MTPDEPEAPFTEVTPETLRALATRFRAAVQASRKLEPNTTNHAVLQWRKDALFTAAMAEAVAEVTGGIPATFRYGCSGNSEVQ
jgi:hypothetical protein